MSSMGCERSRHPRILSGEKLVQVQLLYQVFEFLLIITFLVTFFLGYWKSSEHSTQLPQIQMSDCQNTSTNCWAHSSSNSWWNSSTHIRQLIYSQLSLIVFFRATSILGFNSDERSKWWRIHWVNQSWGRKLGTVQKKEGKTESNWKWNKWRTSRVVYKVSTPNLLFWNEYFVSRPSDERSLISSCVQKANERCEKIQESMRRISCSIFQFEFLTAFFLRKKPS